MKIACPTATCGAVMNLPENAMGKKGRCPRCQEAFTVAPSLIVQAAVAEGVAEEAAEATAPTMPAAVPAPGPPTVPGAVPGPSRGAQTPIGRRRAPSARRVRAETSPDTFEPERRATNAGVLGGIAIMGLAAIWFFVAYFYANRIYFYPPILFVLGLISVFKAVAAPPAPRRRR